VPTGFTVAADCLFCGYCGRDPYILKSDETKGTSSDGETTSAMTHTIRSDDEGPVKQLLRWIPELRQRSGADRLECFRQLCIRAIAEVGTNLQPAQYVVALVAVAAVGRVPHAIESIDRAVRRHGLLIPELEELKLFEGTTAGTQLDGMTVRGRALDDARSIVEDKLVGRSRRRPDTKTSRCEVWLQRIFADGRPHSSLELQRRARQDGLLRAGASISRNSPFKDARKRLGVVITRRGFGPGARYYWSLPAR
jgi:hypothetical protein